MNKKRLVIEIPENLRRAIKMRALEKSLTLKSWLLQAIAEKMHMEQLLEKEENDDV